MPNSFSASLIKGIEYLSLPFQYPQRFLPLLGSVFTARPLVHELPRLTPHRAWFQAAGIRTVIDVGAYIGSFAYAMRTILPEVQIYSFEPLAENYQRLTRTLSPFGRFQAFQTAVGDHTGTLDFFQNDFSPSSSALEMADLHRQAFPQTTRQTRISVPITSLDALLDQLLLQPRILLKMDVQGYEAAVIQGALQLLPQVDYLVTEVSFQELYAGQPLFGAMHDRLQSLGFAFAGNLDSMLSPLDGAILQADALFIRREMA